MYDRIEALCAERGTNVTAMCRQLGISRSSLAELKSGRSKSLNADTVAAIAQYFGTTLDYLVGRTDAVTPQPRQDDGLEEYLEMLRSRPELRIYMDLAKDASKDEVVTAVRIVEALFKGEGGPQPDE